MKLIYIYIVLFFSITTISSYGQHGGNICQNGWLYQDSDNDGFGTSEPDPDLKYCPATAVNSALINGISFVSNNLDCDDTNSDINPNTIWYADLDGDGFGSSSGGTQILCTIFLNGYVMNNDDCNDNDASLNPNTAWYPDNDHDNYGNFSLTPIIQCIKPSGWYSKISDCDDTNPNYNILRVWAIDIDGDGFGESNPTGMVCSPPSNGNYVNNFQDECPGLFGTINGCIIPNVSTTSFSSTDNYIISIQPKKGVSNTNPQSISQEKDVNINITYFNGLGAPIQEINHNQSATGKDIVKHIEYDIFGRQEKEYLQFASSNSNMKFDSNSLSNTLNYIDYQGQIPYNQKQFEASPLNRVLKQAAPGNDWAIGSNHEIRFDYQTNLSSDNVKMFPITATWDINKQLFDIPSSLTVSNFIDNQLFKTVTKNENWTSSDGNNNTTYEFKDKEGKIILKRTFGESNVNGISSNVAHDTYYVYDQYGNLTFVIPPKVDTSSIISSTILDNLCYQYKYDHRNRLVEKKLPGKQWEFIVYDKLDRVVATGPSLPPFSDLQTVPPATPIVGWMITKYDIFNRPVYTGWVQSTTVNSTDRKTLQNTQNGLTTTLNESKTTSVTTIDGVNTNYSNNVAPTSLKLLSVNYYDDYNFPNAPTTFSTVLNDNSGIVYYNNTNIKPKGLPTGSWVRVPELSTTTPVKSELQYTLYDNKARPIRSRTTNYLGGYTQIDNKLDFIGKTLYTETKHKRLSTDTNEIFVKESFTYTDQDRIATNIHQIGTNGTPQLLAKYNYNPLGQVISKNVGGTDTSGNSAFQKVDFSYNIRGWMTGINKVDGSTNPLQQGTDPLDLFAFKINYNTVQNETNYTGKALYNGNIAETYWRTSSDNTTRKYGYFYDDLNRLKNSIYQKPGASIPVTNSYNESLQYDKNGNITSLLRNGEYEDDTAQLQIDNLEYTYLPNSNRIEKILDYSNDSNGFKDDADPFDQYADYEYDPNGNMIFDVPKNIINIKYNHLNLPTEIVFGGTNQKINYLYNSNGVKLKKVVTNGANITTTDYLDGFQYENTILKVFPTKEGYVSNTYAGGVNNFNYVYNFTDHLGNVRLSYTYNSKGGGFLMVFEENHYYPFGLKQKGYNTTQQQYAYNLLAGVKPTPCSNCYYKYKFQGQERQDELGLNWDAFKWRNYDYAIGRFMNVDPLAPDFPQWSPYVFSGNLVTISKELEGMEPEFLVQSDGKLTSGVITLMHAAYGYSVSSLTNSTWIVSSDPRVSGWDKLTGHPEASVKGTQVMYSSKVVNRDENYWFGLISHEQSHRQDVEKQGNLDFYSEYIGEGIFKDYKDISTEARAFRMGSDNKNVDMADKLLSYKNGAVMDIFQRGNLTNNEKASMLEAVGNQFKRDVVLQGAIDGAKSGLSNMKDMKWDDKTKANMTKLLNSLINNWTKQQEEITKKYGN